MALAQYSLNWASSLCGAATNLLHSNTLPHHPPQITVIEDVQIWDGQKYLDETSITIEGQTIARMGSHRKPGATIISGHGGFLMPGLIDAHFHVATGMIAANFENLANDHLKTLVESGITTAFDMGSFPSSKMSQWHDVGEKGLTSLLFSGAAACVTGGFPSILPNYPEDSIITSVENATNYVEDRVREGADYIKIFINAKGEPLQEYQQVIKDTAAKFGKFVVSHAPDFNSTVIAINVGGKFVTHVPKDKAIDETMVQQMLHQDQIAIPTLVMSQNLIHMGKLFGDTTSDYKFPNDSVALMYEMGVPILVGTDASKPLGFVGYGDTLHTELQLLHDAGLSSVDILRGATSLPAKYFGLTDRGKIAPGMRADLLLLDENPIDDITKSQTINQVWTAGTSAYTNNITNSRKINQVWTAGKSAHKKGVY